MENRRPLIWSIVLMGACTVLVFVVAGILGEGSGGYWNVGPHDSLMLLGTRINTVLRYTMLLCFITVMAAAQMYASEYGTTILMREVYNSASGHVIVGFSSKAELRALSSLFYLLNSVFYAFSIMLVVAQVDLAMIAVCAKELIGIYTFASYLENKTVQRFPTSETVPLTAATGHRPRFVLPGGVRRLS